MTTEQHSPFQMANQPGLDGVKNIIAVASGKGGVGKSTVAVNLAVALEKSGYKVGLMDADIYGPSQPGMLGSEARPNVDQNFLYPVKKHNVDFISMGLLVGEDTPVIWRAPMAMKMIMQFINSVVWGELDFLLIDLPPGTGDVQLTLAQQASLTGAVIVTTPQQVALGIAKKGLRMFEQVKVPIVGIIENMSGFTCAHCGEVTDVFKEGGGSQLAEALDLPFLGALPLDKEIMSSGEDGQPVLLNSSDSPSAIAFKALADNFSREAEKIYSELDSKEPRQIQVMPDDNLQIVWPDGHESKFSPYHLRLNCACASCVDEDSGNKILDVKSIPLDIKLKGINPVGRYGLSIGFSDGHNTGIYVFEKLRNICECAECASDKKEESFDL
jgi:ATP-binding protein involved in chromosome partitioning